jgi:hypothetical protein
VNGKSIAHWPDYRKKIPALGRLPVTILASHSAGHCAGILRAAVCASANSPQGRAMEGEVTERAEKFVDNHAYPS